MIKNDKQYQVTRNRLKEFKESISPLEEQMLDPRLKELQLSAMRSQIEDFEYEIREYEMLKEGKTKYIIVDNLANLYKALIKARIAKQWTQADLGKVLSLKEQQIQRYEMSNYSTASLSRVIEVANVLGIDMDKAKLKLNEPNFECPVGINMERLIRFREEKTLILMHEE